MTSDLIAECLGCWDDHRTSFADSDGDLVVRAFSDNGGTIDTDSGPEF